MLIFYTVALVVVFLGIVLNLPGSLHINPILLHFYEPHKVLFLTTVFLTLGAVGRVMIFWKNILWREAWLLGAYGVVGGMLGGLSVPYIPQRIVIIIFFISGGMYLYKHFSKKEAVEGKDYGLVISGFLSSFLQSFGISAGVIRQGYLFSRGHDLVTVQGTIAVSFLMSGMAMIVSRSLHEDIPILETISIVTLFPFMLLTMVLAKKVVYKTPKHIQEYIILYSLIASLILATPYLFE